MTKAGRSRRPRRRFSEEFKAEAARLVIEEERPIRAVARELGIVPSGLERWVKKEEARRGITRPKPEPIELTTDERAELERLRKRVRVKYRRNQTLTSSTILVRLRIVMASRSRKRHVQLEMPRLDRNGQRRGGKRIGAGRKAKGPRSSAAHKMRAELKPVYPQHVTLRVARGVRWLRGWKMFRAIRRALAVSIDTHVDFRICHFSLQGDHLHLICEAEHKLALARGVQGFEISAAKRLNRALGRKRGTIFPDRYHVEAIRTVAHVRHTLSYVLNNWRKHHQDREIRGLYEGRIDPFSSAVWFAGFKERTRPVDLPPDYEPPRVAAPLSWLLREGYKRAASISVYAIPGGGEE